MQPQGRADGKCEDKDAKPVTALATVRMSMYFGFSWRFDRSFPTSSIRSFSCLALQFCFEIAHLRQPKNQKQKNYKSEAHKIIGLYRDSWNTPTNEDEFRLDKSIIKKIVPIKPLSCSQVQRLEPFNICHTPMNNIANTPDNCQYKNREDKEGQQNGEDERNRLPHLDLDCLLERLDKSHCEEHESDRLHTTRPK